MLARARAAAVLGVEAYLVEVEVDLSNGLPMFATVGLPHGAVKEGRERVTAALVNSGFEYPLKRITANLAPADVRKDGSAFDLAIAIAILVASGQLGGAAHESSVLLGELGLNGDLRPVRGVLPMALAARRAGVRSMIVPVANVAEASVIEGIAVYGAPSLLGVARHLSGAEPIAANAPDRSALLTSVPIDGVDFSDVRSQRAAKRALEVAAAGAHNVLMIGSPGTGKTMLARRLPTILPSLTLEEALEVTKIHSVAGLLPAGRPLLTERPFRAPHHTVSDAGLAGGGSTPRPGEVSLAHLGVLFLDELPEFRRHVLEVLRQPLEDGIVTISRVQTSLTYPARVMLVAAMNPCPCGYRGDPGQSCRCPDELVDRYVGRVSGPLYDRLDIHVHVSSVPWTELGGPLAEEPSEAVRTRVEGARALQRARFRSRPGIYANAHMGARDVRHFGAMTGEAESLLGQAMQRFRLSARAYHRIIKIARTIADLDGRELVELPHMAEAVQYRCLDRGRAGGAK
ncbi:MAG: YifB family Mg chelatase-like AAA ATPase [Gemmatimonadota bacterium]